MKNLKTMIVASTVLILMILCSSNVMAAEVINAGWNVYALSDEKGAVIDYLEMDVDYGKRFFRVAGAVGYDDGSSALIYGSGYMIGQKVYFSVSMDVHVLIIVINSDLSGVIGLFDSTGSHIDSGTLQFISSN
jgi:hypothetical protein